MSNESDIWEDFDRILKEYGSPSSYGVATVTIKSKDYDEARIKHLEQDLRYHKKMMWLAWFGWFITLSILVY